MNDSCLIYFEFAPVVMNWGFLENWKSTAPVATLK